MVYASANMAQSQISRTLGGPAARARIAAILAQEHFDSRRALGRRVCEDFSFVNAIGRHQVSGCLHALTSVAARDTVIVLPAPKSGGVDITPRLLGAPVPAPDEVPMVLSRVEGLANVEVVTSDDRALWNTLIAHEHPHGMTTFSGRQLRYLVGSAHGRLGAAALKVAARDRWVAWTHSQLSGQLDRIVCLNRFLIRPSVRCPHLASHVLVRILRRLPRDFAARYGFRPLLAASFADEGYAGTCLRTANFLCVGRTAGRGRQDRAKRRARTVKTVFMFPLDRRWRRELGVPHVKLRPVLEPGKGLSASE